MDLMEKAKKLMLDYSLATGAGICIYDKDHKPVYPESSQNPAEDAICSHCANYPCHDMHKKAIKEAIKKGDCHIYECPLGLIFWVSPIYTDGSFSAAVRGSGFLQDKQKVVDFFSNLSNNTVMCNNEMTKDDIQKRVNSLHGGDSEKIQSLAEMMQNCAESLSSGSGDYQQIIRRRTEQQEAISKIAEGFKNQYDEKADNPSYPLEIEKNLLSALRRGDTAEAKKTLNELLAVLSFFNPKHLNFIQLRIIEIVVLISRIEFSPAKNGVLSMEVNSQNLKAIQEAGTFEELTDILHIIVDRVSGTISSFKGIPHAAALRKAENFILENFTRKISLKEIADEAGLSPPYFSTIFKEEMGENLSKYLNRLRVEKAGRLLLETNMSLSEIAANCCFEDQSWFSKIFKAYAGISPGKYRNQGGAR